MSCSLEADGTKKVIEIVSDVSIQAVQLGRGRKETVKTGFRAKDAKNAKKLLQGELVEFVYESLDVTFEKFTAKVYQ